MVRPFIDAGPASLVRGDRACIAYTGQPTAASLHKERKPAQHDRHIGRALFSSDRRQNGPREQNASRRPLGARFAGFQAIGIGKSSHGNFAWTETLGCLRDRESADRWSLARAGWDQTGSGAQRDLYGKPLAMGSEAHFRQSFPCQVGSYRVPHRGRAGGLLPAEGVDLIPLARSMVLLAPRRRDAPRECSAHGSFFASGASCMLTIFHSEPTRARTWTNWIESPWSRLSENRP